MTGYRIVTETALVKRINRALAPACRKVQRARTRRDGPEFGQYVELENGFIVASQVDLVDRGHELKVLAYDEAVAS